MWPSIRILPVAAAVMMSVFQPFEAAADPFSFRGLALGTPLGDLRRLKFPEASGARVICTNDPEAADLRPSQDFNAQADEIRAGVMICGSFNFARMFGSSPSSLPPEWIPAKIQAAGVDVSPTFWYVPADGDPASTAQPRLFRIAMRSNSAFWDETKAAFTRRYGAPARVEKIPYTGYRGNRLDNEKVVWSNPESTIALTKRGQMPNQLLIVFEHNALTPAGSRLGQVPATAPGAMPDGAGDGGRSPG